MKILIYVPTRDRPERLKQFLDSFDKFTEGNSFIIVGVDEDQSEMYAPVVSHHPSVAVVVTHGEEFAEKVNKMHELTKDVYTHEYYYILSDDFIIESPFESEMLEAAEGRRFFMGFGNDGIKGESLATAIMMSREIPDAVGYINPSSLKHLYCDNVWTEWGKELNCLYYFQDIKITHNHFTKNPELIDDLYKKSNNKAVFDMDRMAFDRYMRTQFNKDIKKVLTYTR